ncbi:cysteine-rich CWC family protein [Paraburkholderia sp. BL10I2N1]|uniref:cysteine-rich CWC family protein n=1 Tax=Paraburkholderia sp. BL10I2N1 TaxID=1938796 RepID=UPI0010622E1E|nr:cysteine-rich CWC family protein [Paraburkholderia sp. BL10I2N1]TDN68171.1 cysteine-rich CWC protein [Paraburkholderia sp. BL10I2N1]
MNLSGSSSQGVGRARCPRCGRSFDCGRGDQASECWCRSMPALPAERLEAGRGCLCPECLAEEIARAQLAGRSPDTVRG